MFVTQRSGSSKNRWKDFQHQKSAGPRLLKILRRYAKSRPLRIQAIQIPSPTDSPIDPDKLLSTGVTI
ncbi:hypothetical protein JXJ21_24235 [candidate division KSB1 bacterium]|nr:hypothetical protein [candidate division KSB1 bacterium]